MNEHLPAIDIGDIEALVASRGLGAAGRIGDLVVIANRMAREGERSHGLIVARTQEFRTHDRMLLTHCAGLAELLLQRPQAMRSIRQENNALAMAIQIGVDQDEHSMGRVFQEAADAHGRVRPVLIVSESARAHDKLVEGLDRILSMSSRLTYELRLDERSSLCIFRGNRSVDNIRETLHAV